MERQKRKNQPNVFFGWFSSIGMTGFEPATPRTPCVCSTKLSYIPKWFVRHTSLYKKNGIRSMANFSGNQKRMPLSASPMLTKKKASSVRAVPPNEVMPSMKQFAPIVREYRRGMLHRGNRWPSRYQIQAIFGQSAWLRPYQVCRRIPPIVARLRWRGRRRRSTGG